MLRKKPLDVCLIFAHGTNGAFGLNNGLAWHIPEDLKHYKKHTLGNAVIMGRKTFESMPSFAFKDRLTFVLTSHQRQDQKDKNIFFVSSLLDALRQTNENNDVKLIYVVGGKTVLEQAQQWAKKAYITKVHYEGPYDVERPIMYPFWKKTHSEQHTSEKGYLFEFETWENPRYLNFLY